MAAERRWARWLRALALLWGRAGMGLAHLAATAPPAPGSTIIGRKIQVQTRRADLPSSAKYFIWVKPMTCYVVPWPSDCIYLVDKTDGSYDDKHPVLLNENHSFWLKSSGNVNTTCSEFSQRSCEECLKNVACLWCYTNNTCIDYPVRSILPPSSLCSLSNARWGVCWINFEALIIAIAVVAGLILVSITVCCCYCCYCRRRSRSRPDEEEERLARKREEQRLQSLKRKHERKMKHDEIRKKYGLLQDSDNPYSRLENE